jgi:crotonobetainyl-CoA:carnitine CoA-transferase CaiB-like acyl-CoA transferase
MGPLSGIRVADFTRVVSGPYCTMLLGDLGAEVVKVEQPGKGDDTRTWGPPFVGGESTYYLSVNRNKKSVCLNLRDERDQARARALILRSDVVAENFRPGYMDRLGLGYDTLRAEKPGLIYCSISGYGSSGPYRDRAGYDVTLQALGGLMGITGEPAGTPVKTGVALVDVITALQACAGILAALYHRERTGEGQQVEVSLLGAELSALINAGSAYLVASEISQRLGTAHASIVPYQVFQAADGYVMVGAANDKLFASFCAEIGHAEWAQDARFVTNAERVRHRAELLELIEVEVRTDTVANWVGRLETAGVAVAPVNDMAQVFHDPQVAYSSQVRTIQHPTIGALQLVGPALSLSRTPAEVRLPPPLLGEHTDELMQALDARSEAERPSCP